MEGGKKRNNSSDTVEPPSSHLPTAVEDCGDEELPTNSEESGKRQDAEEAFADDEGDDESENGEIVETQSERSKLAGGYYQIESVTVRKVHQMNQETVDLTAESETDDLCCLSGDKPFFDVTMLKSHVEYPYRLAIPLSIASMLPQAAVPAVLAHGGKKWSALYHGESKRHYLDHADWRKFAVDNNLAMGDACIFEVMESSTTILKLRVVILRDVSSLPPELGVTGDTAETPIEFD